jgi:hypothetical protein
MAEWWDDSMEQSYGGDTQSYETALATPEWQMPDDSGGGGMWDNFSAGLGKIDWGGLGQAAIPGLASLGTGYLASKLFPDTPGKQQLIDPRTTEQQTSQQNQLQGQQNQLQTQGMGLARMSALEQNPMSFGLPGDPYDVNTPAGKRRYDITKSQRSADAARGALDTGGSAVRETTALNRAIGDSYNQVWGQAAGIAGQGVGGIGGPSLQYETTPGVQNPWGKLVASAATPVAAKTIEELMAELGGGR